MSSTSERLTTVELKTKSNEKSIRELTSTIQTSMEKLALSIEKSIGTFSNKVDELDEKVDTLINTTTKYEYEIIGIHAKLENKKQQLETKADRMSIEQLSKEFKELKAFIHKALWWLFGGMAGIIAYLLKETVFKI
jgi:predicted  nucleic acid-binding Zn-ribbon protein